eukprot:Skav221385  [mRNA]  locus=scaffold4031:12519:14713:- [translate_table: standard]
MLCNPQQEFGHEAILGASQLPRLVEEHLRRRGEVDDKVLHGLVKALGSSAQHQLQPSESCYNPEEGQSKVRQL